MEWGWGKTRDLLLVRLNPLVRVSHWALVLALLVLHPPLTVHRALETAASAPAASSALLPAPLFLHVLELRVARVQVREGLPALAGGVRPIARRAFAGAVALAPLFLVLDILEVLCQVGARVLRLLARRCRPLRRQRNS